MVLCYFQLCAEDYEWWWRAVANSGTSALYVFLYSAWYFFANLEISRAVPSIMYFAYSMALVCRVRRRHGAVGFLACFAFCRAISRTSRSTDDGDGTRESVARNAR